MKITILGEANNPHIVKWVDAFRNEHEIQIITDRKNPDLGTGVEQVSFHLKPAHILVIRQLVLLWDIFRVRLALRRFRPRFIHVHYLLPHSIAYALPKNIPLISSLWGSDIVALPGEPFSERKMKYLHRYLSRSKAITVTSPYLAHVYHRLFRNKYGTPRVVPFSIDTELFSPRTSGPSHEVFTIGFAKTLFRHYGLEDLIVAIAPWVHSRQLRLLVAGDGPDAEVAHYHDLVKELHLEDMVTFLGRVKPYEMPDFYRKLDVFVIPSYREAFGVAALEASASGIPVIGTNVGGLKDVIVPEKTGLLIERGDREGLRMALKRLMSDDQLRNSLGKAGREFVTTHFQRESSIALMREVYRDVAA